LKVGPWTGLPCQFLEWRWPYPTLLVVNILYVSTKYITRMHWTFSDGAFRLSHVPPSHELWQHVHSWTFYYVVVRGSLCIKIKCGIINIQKLRK
jgi:hypothetical protein